MKLYEISSTFAQLFEQYDAICSYEPEKNEQGQYVDGDGVVIEDLEAFRTEMGEAWFDTLEGIEGEFMDKAENIAVYIKELNSEAASMKVEEQKLHERRKVKENAVQHLKSYLLGEMEHINLKKIDSTFAKITYNAGRQSVNITDEKAFREWAQENRKDLLVYKAPEISKSAVMADIAAGKEIAYAEIVRKPFINIK